MTSAFQQGVQIGLEQFSGTATGQSAAAYCSRVEVSVEELIRDMRLVAVNLKDAGYAKGDVAELWHAGTINLDATQRGIDVLANAPRDAGLIDVVVRDSGYHEVVAAQLKYYQSAEHTVRAISDPKFDGFAKVAPSDQLDNVRAAALRLASDGGRTAEHQASFEHTAKIVDDRLRLDGAQSRPLTEEQSRLLVDQLRANGDIDRPLFGIAPEQVVKLEEVLRAAAPAALQAALITAALQAAPHLVAIAKKAIETGELAIEDFQPLGSELPPAILRSSLAGGITAALVAAAQKELLGASLKNLDPMFISAAVVLCMSVVRTSVAVARGQLSTHEAGTRIAEDSFTLAMSIGLGAVGQALIPIPVLGTLVGSVVGALVARVAIEAANQAVLAVAVNTGWTVFGLVEQSYEVPTSILTASGWETVELELIAPRAAKLRLLEPRKLDLESLDMTVLRRGVVSFRRVGYAS